MVDLRIHSILRRSRANGPGIRYVVWFQGCSQGCPGCFNPDTHDPAGGYSVALEDLAGEIAARQTEFEGITISGGEPLEQSDALLALLSAIRASTGLSVMLFSGRTIEEIRAMPNGPAILALTDVLIDGRYDPSRHLGMGLRGSDNQRVHLLTDRYTLEEVEAVPQAEVIIGADGTLTLSGVHPVGPSPDDR